MFRVRVGSGMMYYAHNDIYLSVCVCVRACRHQYLHHSVTDGVFGL